jgi:hypothetical protein
MEEGKTSRSKKTFKLEFDKNELTEINRLLGEYLQTLSSKNSLQTVPHSEANGYKPTIGDGFQQRPIQTPRIWQTNPQEHNYEAIQKVIALIYLRLG